MGKKINITKSQEKSLFISRFIWIVLASLMFIDCASAQWVAAHKGKSDTIVIFVHGLRGDPTSSFRNPQTNKTWAELMQSDRKRHRNAPALADHSIGYISYPAGEDDRLSIPEITTRSIFFLEEAGVLDVYKKIVFVTHSLGGLLVKDMITTAWKRNNALAGKTQAVFLISVPSKGAPIANWVDAVSKSPLVADAKSIDVSSFLKRLDGDWEAFLRARDKDFPPRVFCAYEKKRTFGVMVVPMPSAATVCDAAPWPENKDHFSIAKPESVDASIYKWVRDKIATSVRARVNPPERDSVAEDSASVDATKAGGTKRKCPPGSLRVGQHKIVGSVRHRNCTSAPTWAEIRRRLPAARFGRLSNGGTGKRASKACKKKVRTRLVRYTATKRGKERLIIFGDPATITVCG